MLTNMHEKCLSCLIQDLAKYALNCLTASGEWPEKNDIIVNIMIIRELCNRYAKESDHFTLDMSLHEFPIYHTAGY